MTIQTVSSENGGQEGVWIASLCALILFLGWLLLPYNQALSTHAEVASHQVSIKDLSNKPLAMIADLRLAHEEIHHLYQEQGEWVSIVQLEEVWLAPFVKDKSWLHQGEHHWQLVAPGAYQGVASTEGEHARYILNSIEAEVDIWTDLQGTATLLEKQDMPLQTAQLIQAGWTQVAFADELKTHTSH